MSIVSSVASQESIPVPRANVMTLYTYVREASIEHPLLPMYPMPTLSSMMIDRRSDRRSSENHRFRDLRSLRPNLSGVARSGYVVVISSVSTVTLNSFILWLTWKGFYRSPRSTSVSVKGRSSDPPIPLFPVAKPRWIDCL